MGFDTDGFFVTSDIGEMDTHAIYREIHQSYWANGIPEAVFRKSLDHSLCFGLMQGSTQIGFARMVTDRATFAYLGDVYVDKACRGRGLAKFLLTKVFEHPDLQGLRRTMLATADAHGLYRHYGFTDLAQPANLMEVWRPDVYRAD